MPHTLYIRTKSPAHRKYTIHTISEYEIFEWNIPKFGQKIERIYGEKSTSRYQGENAAIANMWWPVQKPQQAEI